MKAALVLADMTASQLAAEVEGDLQVGVATIERIMQGRRAPKPWEITRFATALGVPESFLTDGLHGMGDGAPGDREDAILAALRDLDRKLDVAALEQKIGLLEGEIRTLVVALRESAR